MRSATHYRTENVAFIPEDRGAEWCPLQFWSASTPMRLDSKPRGDAVPAVVNHGRWIVRCPFCTSAELACLSDPRFMCCECGNAENLGSWCPVRFPEGIPAIEAALSARPLPLQNMEPGETLADLLAENDELRRRGVILK